MSKSIFYTRQDSTLKAAWASAFLELSGHTGRELAPFTASVASGSVLADSVEDPMVKALDASLNHDGHQSVETVAFTIFPERLWKLCCGDREELYREYMASLPAYVKWESLNQNGLYFARLIGFGVNHKTGKPLGFKPTKALTEQGNQLEHIIKQCKKGVAHGRKAARMQLQAAAFDPFRDLTTVPRPRFPCLQHIAFDPDIGTGGLALSAFYATQQLFVKAYGNWLGLCRLGAFVAAQSGLKLTRFTCFAGVQKMDMAPKSGQAKADLLRAAKEVADQVATGGQAVARHAC